MTRHFAISLSITALLASACSGDARCAVDGDCFAGEACVDQVCTVSGATPEPTVSTPDVGVTDTAQGVDQGTANSANPGIDLGDHSADGGDLTDEGDAFGEPDVTDPLACTVDPFTFTCEDDAFEPNNTWIDGARLTTTLGCNTAFEDHQSSYVATMCPLDGSDWYHVDFVACDDGDYVLEWQVQLESECDPDVIDFEPLSYGCDESFVDCSVVDGKPTIRMIVSKTNFQNLQSSYVQVHHRDQDDVTFDYRISVSVRR